MKLQMFLDMSVSRAKRLGVHRAPLNNRLVAEWATLS